MASAAVPEIFPTVEVEGAPLMDGAIAANTPLWLAKTLGASRIIVLPTGYACAFGKAACERRRPRTARDHSADRLAIDPRLGAHA